ncbi:DUF3326 domain-containing protein [bacterium]|nr:DUF3326 domain-containing protein [bacterium]
MKTGAFIIPTGVGASIGGYAGDACVWARKISKKCILIVNPNAVNAACFSGITDNMLYVEGYSLDEFFRGNLNLIPKTGNKIGVVFDKSISQRVLNVHINTINAVKTVYGIDVIGYEITKEEVGVEFYLDKSGASMGNVKNLSTLKDAAEKLIEKGAEAIAIVCSFPEEDSEDYANAIGADPVGGVEAIISHYISKELKIPCAHAPAFENIEISTEIVNPKASAEYITPTFLPCILLGLNQGAKILYSPHNTLSPKEREIGIISVNDIDFLITPYDSMGNIPVLEMNKLGKKIYAIKENQTVLNVTAEKISATCDIINTYEELLELL